MYLDVSKQVKQKVTSPSLSVHGLAEAITYTFRVRAETFDYGPESVGNITTGPQEGNYISRTCFQLPFSFFCL